METWPCAVPWVLSIDIATEGPCFFPKPANFRPPLGIHGYPSAPFTLNMRQMQDIAINRIMTTDPLTVGPDESVADAKELLESNAIHHLPVVVDGILVGILSSSDFLKLHILRERTKALEAIKVSQIMEPEPVTLDVFADLVDVASKLSEGGFHAVPVVEADNVLVGIVTSTDLINHLLRQVPRSDGSPHEID